ncbi:MAG: hypothetical protein R3247_14940 [Rhodothermales bacterium]|nr:hypothetical protein [Rhodothermales bacterium]
MLPVLLAAALMLVACEESVDPILGTDQAFTLYGFLDAGADTQAVRVFLIEDLLAPERPDPLDAEVRSINVASGQATAWRDSTVRFASGAFGHVYFAPLQVAFEQTYRVIARRSDGAESAATVTVPPETEAVPLDPFVTGEDVFIPVLWLRAPRLNDIRVRYVMRILEIDPVSGDTLDAGTRRVTVDYGEAQVPTEDGIVAVVTLRRDRRIFFASLGLTGDQRTVLCRIEQRVLVSNAEWTPPGGAYDPDVLVQPGTFTNVEGGFGFVGAGYEASAALTVPDVLLASVGYLVAPAYCEGVEGSRR